MIRGRRLGVGARRGLLAIVVLLGACATSRPPSAVVLQTQEATRRIEIHAQKPSVLSVARDALEAEGGHLLAGNEPSGAQATFSGEVSVVVSVETQESLARIEIRGESRNPSADVPGLVDRLERRIRTALEQLR